METSKIQRVIKALVVGKLIATWQNMVGFSRLPKKTANCLGNGKVIGNAL